MPATHSSHTWTLRLIAAIAAGLLLIPSICSVRCSSLCPQVPSQRSADSCHHASEPDNSLGLKASPRAERCAFAEIASIAPRPNRTSNSDATTFTHSVALPSLGHSDSLQLPADAAKIAQILQTSPPTLSTPLRI
jgi:hypothetical protein